MLQQEWNNLAELLAREAPLKRHMPMYSSAAPERFWAVPEAIAESRSAFRDRPHLVESSAPRQHRRPAGVLEAP